MTGLDASNIVLLLRFWSATNIFEPAPLFRAGGLIPGFVASCLLRDSAVPAFHLMLRLFLTLILAAASVRAAPAQKPNVILILADDFGWTDLASYGSDLHETPAIDQLARDGMKFTQNYSACTVCSPTRAALMTGKYPARLHITDWIPGQMPANPKLLVPDWTKFLPHSEVTLAEVFKAAGYTTASIGKWHLGSEAYYPTTQGFDLNIAGTDKPSPTTYHAPWKIPTLSEGKDGDYLTDRLGEEAVKFIEQTKDKPFFLYLPHFAVHTPIQGRADLVQKYEKKIKEGMTHKNAAYAAMTESMDMTVGLVRKKLADLETYRPHNHRVHVGQRRSRTDDLEQTAPLW
jgi:arylsulfatase A